MLKNLKKNYNHTWCERIRLNGTNIVKSISRIREMNIILIRNSMH